MIELAYKKLMEAIKNNELNLFFKTDKKYLVVDSGNRGEYFNIDYYAMAAAINKYIKDNPSNKQVIVNGIMQSLKNSSVAEVKTIIEITAFQLRYVLEAGFLTEEILVELKKQIYNHREEFLNNPEYNYEKLDEMVYRSSGRHFL